MDNYKSLTNFSLKYLGKKRLVPCGLRIRLQVANFEFERNNENKVPKDRDNFYFLLRTRGRKVFLFFFFALFLKQPGILYCQTIHPDSSFKKWGVELGFWNGLKFNGHVQVGELEYTGDKLNLVRDLGMNYLFYPSITISRQTTPSSVFKLSVGRFFFSGHHTLNRDIFYNGALISGAEGLSINQTIFYRVKLSYERSLSSISGYTPHIIGGLVYDALTFYVNGTLLPGYGLEQKEDFVTQSLPYPFLGGSLTKSLSAESQISLELSGTYIPRFKSFFNEGGVISLHYATADCSLTYWLTEKRFHLGGEVLWRLIKTYEYSAEDDPNDFLIHALGIQLNLKYEFGHARK